jgi:Cap4 SAVED domain
MGSSLFEEWFARESPFDDLPLLVCCAEIEGAREVIDSALQTLIIDHLIGIDHLAKLIDRPAAVLAAVERVPRSPREMSGDFGEILAAAYVEECSEFRVPLRRLRYKADREYPMQGDDIVALAVDGSTRLLKGEAKSRQSLDVAAIQAADEALNARDGRPKPETLGFLSMRLRELGEDDAAQVVEAFLDDCDDRQLEHLLFTVSGNDRRDLLQQHADSERESIQRHVTGVVIADHGDFVAGVFKRVREAVSG